MSRFVASGAFRAVLLLAGVLPLLTPGATDAAEFFTLKGHGGPIMDVTVSAVDGRIASASFDNSVGLWRGVRPVWLEGHAAAVNVVEFVGDDRLVSAGDDFSVIAWNRADGASRILGAHLGKVVDLAVSPDARLVASASWDGRIGLWPLEGGEPAFLEGTGAGINTVAFSRDGRRLYAGAVDGTVRIWDLARRSQERLLVRKGFGVNRLVLGGHGTDGIARWVAYGTVNGLTRVISAENGEELAGFAVDRGPVLSLVLDHAGRRLARGDGQGHIMLIDTATWRVEHDFQAALRGPIWALAFSRDDQMILAGGIENIVYAWPLDIVTQLVPMRDSSPAFLRDPALMGNGERQFARKCSICHALGPESGRKAGPTLHGIFGRRAGSLPGYGYSETLAESELVWTEDTIDRLFDLGPDHYIPGSKMPMQRITGAGDRRDLVEFLKRATAR